MRETTLEKLYTSRLSAISTRDSAKYSEVMKRTITLLLCGTSVASITFGQEEVHHHNITAGLGAAIPVGATTNYLGAAPLFSIGYGYRFNRFFQADAGAQFAFGAANNQNVEITDFGQVQGGDHEYMIPLGGRVYIPQPFKRFEVSAGGGTMYLHYSETVSSNGGEFSTSCYSCTFSWRMGRVWDRKRELLPRFESNFSDRQHSSTRLRID